MTADADPFYGPPLKGRGRDRDAETNAMYADPVSALTTARRILVRALTSGDCNGCERTRIAAAAAIVHAAASGAWPADPTEVKDPA